MSPKTDVERKTTKSHIDMIFNHNNAPQSTTSGCTLSPVLSRSNIWLRFFVAVVCASLVVGCSGRKDVVTQDDSAEYREAKTLPPLKKPSADVQRESVTASAQIDPASTPAQQPAALIAENLEPESTLTAAAQAQTKEAISATVIDNGGGEAQLLIPADLERAWFFVRNNLNKSDITVHSRNKAASRVLIGCAGIEDVESDTATESSKRGWSIFNRSSKEELEHCALQLVGSKDSTLVNVLNRSGEVAPGAASKQVFSRLLNN